MRSLLVLLIALATVPAHSWGWRSQVENPDTAVSADTAYLFGSVDHRAAWVTTDGKLHLTTSGRPRTLSLPCAAVLTHVVQKPCTTTSISLGHDAAGKDVATLVLVRGSLRRLLDIPLDGSPGYRPVRRPLPGGTIAASQQGDRILIAVERYRDFGGGPIHQMRGIFAWRHGRWASVSRVAHPRSLQQAGSRVLFDTYDFADQSHELRLLDLAHPSRPRVLAHTRDTLGNCRDYVVCSTYERGALTRRYAYAMEFAITSPNVMPVDGRQEVSYLCRFDLRDPSNVTRWQAPRTLGGFTVVAGTLFAGPRSDGDPLPGVYRFRPKWTPATTATPLEADGPCETRPPTAK